MTRTQDLAGGDRPSTTTGADLKARTDLANAARVDLFVSIHNNALSTTTSGTETFHYYYSSAAARTLATAVQRELVAALGLPDRGVKTAGFYVLRNSEMPAILVEGGFLTNPAEALLLADPNVRQRIAEAVGRGIAAYAAQGVATPPRLAPTLGPWKTKPATVPAGYRLVKTGVGNPVGRGGWLAVIVGFAPPPSPLPATIGPWKVKPKTHPGRVPPREERPPRTRSAGAAGWRSSTPRARSPQRTPAVGRRTAPGADRSAGAVPRPRGELGAGTPLTIGAARSPRPDGRARPPLSP